MLHSNAKKRILFGSSLPPSDGENITPTTTLDGQILGRWVISVDVTREVMSVTQSIGRVTTLDTAQAYPPITAMYATI